MTGPLVVQIDVKTLGRKRFRFRRPWTSAREDHVVYTSLVRADHTAEFLVPPGREYALGDRCYWFGFTLHNHVAAPRAEKPQGDADGEAT